MGSRFSIGCSTAGTPSDKLARGRPTERRHRPGVYRLRTKAHLTQKQLAERIGTTASVISRLESADYEGHSLSMLQRISAALNRRIEVRFVPLRTTRTHAKHKATA